MKRLIVLVAVLTTFAFVACGGSGSGNKWPTALELKNRDIVLVPVQHSLELGDKRFSLGLQDKNDELILHATVTLRFFKISGENGTLKSEMPAPYVGFDTSSVEELPDGTRRTVPGPQVGVYVAPMTFDEAGDWGVEASGAQNGKKFGPERLRFEVLDSDSIPHLGDPAPPSRQLTLRDVNDVSEIDTTNPPNPGMHDTTVADALKTGKPIVIAFSTPAFCTSRTCGPVTDKVVVPLYKKYGDQAVFIHIEPYDLNKARESGDLEPVPTLTEWGLQTEPWVFVVDKQGRVAGKFEGIMGIDEAETVIQKVLQ